MRVMLPSCLALLLLSPFALAAGPAQSQEWPAVEIRDGRFVDQARRTLTFRGVNVGGSSKVPLRPYLPSHRAEGFFLHRDVSFVGRPFPLAEADEHFRRIASWGFNLVRLVVTWEAIEHAGPGIYDEDYLDYVRRLVEKASEHGLWVLIDPHQDAWSRFTGGDGAPGWTLEAVGFDLEGLPVSGAAVVHNVLGDPYPKMIWPTNYTRLGSATMFTLFFGGDDFAPATRIAGIPAREYLQSHFCSAFRALASRLRGLPNVLGYETLNEPHPGWIGQPHAGEYCNFPLRQGPTPTPFQSMTAGAGLPTEVAVWQVGLLGLRHRGTATLGRRGRSAWRQAEMDVWRANGVWRLGTSGQPELLRERYFYQVAGREVDFAADYYKPFVERFMAAIRSVDPEAILFVQPAFIHGFPDWQDGELQRVASSAHWYDQVTLVKKSFFKHFGLDLRSGSPVFGAAKIDEMFVEQVAGVGAKGRSLGGQAPTLVGEVGIPFDLNRAKAFASGDFTAQILALDRSIRALEQNLLSYCLWNYTADNTHLHGDQWNGEDLSIFSRDQMTEPADLDSGGRALRAVVRPYPIRVAGTLRTSEFDVHRGRYTLVFLSGGARSQESLIFLPSYYFPDPPRVGVSDGEYRFDVRSWVLSWVHAGTHGWHRLTVEPPRLPERLEPLLSPWWLLLAALALGAWWLVRRRRLDQLS